MNAKDLLATIPWTPGLFRADCILFIVASFLLAGCASHQRESGAITTKTYTLTSWDPDVPGMKIDVPVSFTFLRQEGPDFDVFYFSDPSAGDSVSIYVGNHPRLHSKEATGARKQPGRIGIASVEWLRWSQGGICQSETLVKDVYGQILPPEQAGLVLHIFISAPTEQEVSRLEKAVASLRQERAK
jgi:hypothetical protein